MNNTEQHPKPPSQKQVDCLTALAEKTGRSFTWPKTSRQASEEIKSLLGKPNTPSAERRRETQQIRADLARGNGGASRVRRHELSGYGSTARWGQRSLPSEKQLNLLERLTRAHGVEFVMPATKREASRMIDDLLPAPE